MIATQVDSTPRDHASDPHRRLRLRREPPGLPAPPTARATMKTQARATPHDSERPAAIRATRVGSEPLPPSRHQWCPTHHAHLRQHHFY